jgi:hypothetical protein
LLQGGQLVVDRRPADAQDPCDVGWCPPLVQQSRVFEGAYQFSPQGPVDEADLDVVPGAPCGNELIRAFMPVVLEKCLNIFCRRLGEQKAFERAARLFKLGDILVYAKQSDGYSVFLQNG